jgi:NADH-quinone oxidoreductase subunit J
MEWLSLVIAPLALLSAVAVVAFRNPINSALSLVVNLLLVACLYGLQQAAFLAIVQVMVYAGAIVVLMLFMIMLLNEQFEARSAWFWSAGLFALAIAAIFLNLFIQGAFSGLTLAPLQNLAGDASNIGRLLFGKYGFTFEVASLLILVGLVAIVMLGRPLKDSNEEQK